MNGLTIGAVARRAGVNLQTIRFYERKRIIPRSARSASGYRLFGPDDVRRIQFIRQAQSLGFSLREIRDLIGIQADPRADCAEIRAKADAKVAEIDAKIRTLTAMKNTLTRLAGRCPSKGPVEGCPIWDCLNTEPLEPGANEKPTGRGCSRARPCKGAAAKAGGVS